MDKWKLKELKAMELGGNAKAKVYYDAQGMTKDGRPDHEAAPHARYKMELAAVCEAAIQEQAPQYAQLLQVQVKKEETMPLSVQSMNVAPINDPFANKSTEKVEEKKAPAAAPQLQTKTIVSTQSSNKLDAPAEFKQLDFGLDMGDDAFFDSFTGPGVTKIEANTFGSDFALDEKKPARQKKSNKLQEISEADNNPFGGMVNQKSSSSSAASSKPVVAALPQISFDFGGDPVQKGPAVNECTNDAAYEKLMSMNSNRKGISSDDLFTDMQQSEAMKERFAQLSGA